ncbi:MAG TPA: 50S ribosomal protein L19 [Planctomycetota bacterium]|nr:50S ribosomal protein L19 [Planctomycetota bacterium]
MDKMKLVEQPYLKAKIPQFRIGDTVDVHVKILEASDKEAKKGKEEEPKERIQIFNGTVIARSGSGINEMFCVRRIVAGEGVERVFPIHSPSVVDIVVQRSGKVRRAKLYYLRDRIGKATKVKERVELQGANAKMSKAEKKAARKAKTPGAAAPAPKAEPATAKAGK